jgi:uncharacterized phage protein (TIGR01671 family)
MREIRFRAWGSFGQLSTSTNPQPRMVYDWQDSDLIEYVGLNGGDFYNVMQFTGLRDKNGRRIYEGDIYRWLSWNKTERIGVVEYEIGFGGDGETWSGFGFPSDITRLDDDDEPWRDVEVIGNIYENPELLEKKP